MNKDIEQLMKALKKQRKELKDPVKAKAFALKMGFIDENGESTDHGKKILEAIAYVESKGGYKGPGATYE